MPPARPVWPRPATRCPGERHDSSCGQPQCQRGQDRQRKGIPHKGGIRRRCRRGRACGGGERQPQRRGQPPPGLVLALEQRRHPVRASDRAQGGRPAQLLHGLDGPAGGVATPGLRLPLAAERGGLLRRRPGRPDHDQQDPGRARPDRDPQGDDPQGGREGAALAGARTTSTGSRTTTTASRSAAGTSSRWSNWPIATRSVYRYVRRIFSRKFAPIGPDNVWHRLLPELRQHPAWERLAARTAAEEDRASARTRAGHANRRGTNTNTQTEKDTLATPSTADTGNDTSAVVIGGPEPTIVAFYQQWFRGGCCREQQRFRGQNDDRC